jgi:RimJ/RimL family protein N-acetyltransferase
MLTQLLEEKKDLIKPLFQKKQPNNSALWCYFEGKMPGKTFVDDISAPTKAICRLDMSWTYISDNADFPWIESVLGEIIKKDWLQVIWVPERTGTYPLKEVATIIPRLEYTERKEPSENPCSVEITPYTSELYDKLPEDYKEWHIQNYGSKEEFLKKAFGFFAVENGEVCSESEAAFIANGYAEMGIYTFEPYRNRGFAFATCLKTIKELEKKGLKTIWACDKENTESDRLAKRLGYVNPLEYEFLYFPVQN